MWDELQSSGIGAGIIHNHCGHCGIGLVRDSTGFALVEVEDGDACDPPLLRWANLSDFVDYWSRQSDYGLSEAEVDHPEL